ncbi:diguanylate cyclase domain-containing protein [Crocosphaera chwakensis]|uniref:Sensor domain-containing diguanylate cyclase n=1 Tax=Crocosphaera chwakensis CCY0110 TaxID=391612 RepID=A3IUI4_9CHRO|nr:diguanylate cyclase [Crocosphaera chwakensis]EAZ89871.1 hypothetical protein CY0110_06284 [Crocosphaera chwakensis CCY0110]
MSWGKITQILIVALLYFLSGKASFFFSVSHSIVTLVVFTAEGWALAAIILCGVSIWPGIFLGQLLLAVNNGLPLILALGISTVNSLEAIIGLKLFKGFHLDPNLASIRDISGLQILIFLGLQPFSATCGTFILWMGGILPTSEYANAWFSWWFGNALGQILLTPVLLSLFSQFQVKNNQLFKGFLTLLPLVGLAWLVFFVTEIDSVSTTFAIFMPLLVFMAVRQGMAMVTLGTFLIASITLYATHKSMGPFVINGKAQLVDLNIFLLGAIMTAQFVAALFSELKDRENQLQRLSTSVFDHVQEAIVILNSEREIVDVNHSFIEITGYTKNEEKLLQMALFDPLTGLPNRRLMCDRLTQEMYKASRNNHLIAICYLDLDGFKKVNDTLGHEVGDRLLIEIAARLKACLRSGDSVARMGGDEFVIILSSLSGEQQCYEILQRIIDVANEPVLIDSQIASVSVSIGFTLYPQDNSDIKTLIRHADTAMYCAKKTGKGSYYLFDPDQERVY